MNPALAMALRAAHWMGRKTCAALLLGGCFVQGAADPPPAAGAPASGEALARRYCQACHLFPEPDLLDRRTWANHTLRRMAPFLGVARLNLDRRPDGEVLRGAPIFPAAPTLPESEWQAIVAYYLRAAPVEALPPPPRAPIERRLDRFVVQRVSDARVSPAITLVRIDSATHQVELGDARAPGLHLLDARGSLLATAPLPSAPTSMALVGTQRWVTAIGDLFPSDLPSGAVLRLPRDLNATGNGTMPVPAIPRLKRPVDLALADLNGDQRLDLVVAQFGNYLGRLSWFEALPDGQFRDHILSDLPGALKVVIRDFTGDGRPDVLAQMAQGREGFFLHENRGDGTFLSRTLLEFPPAHGSTGFELVDMDQDGLDDLLVTNGDNAEYESPFKRYHGIRIYRQEAGLKFVERWFFPLNGAFKALARDFDGDGDRDVIAISLFPDYEKSPEECLVYLENRGNGHFAPSTLEDPLQGRWFTLDAGDLDGDGDVDVVLGSLNEGPRGTPIPSTIQERWQREPVAALILRNRTIP